ALSNARARAQTTVCAATQRQLGVAIRLYGNDNRNQTAPGWGCYYDPAFYYAHACDNRAGNWMVYGRIDPQLIPAAIGLLLLSRDGYAPDLRLYYCPTAPKELPGSYDNYWWGPVAAAGPGWDGWQLGAVKIATVTQFVVSSYYYRYAGGSDPTGILV